jgi:hypothetical protein
MVTCQGRPNEIKGTEAKDGLRDTAICFAYCWVLTTETELSEISHRSG